jgi:predicted Zn-dependent protease
MNTRERRFVMLMVVAGIAGMAGEATAQESWVGQSVLYTKPSKEIKFGDVVQGKQVYYPISKIAKMLVQEDREGWLRIHDGHREGWVDKGDFVLVRDAPAYFHRRVQANPKDTYALAMRGVGWLEKGEPDNAIQDFNEYIRLDPTVSAAFNNRGRAWNFKKEYDKAIRDYDEAIRLDPTDSMGYNNRAWLWATCPQAKYRDGKRAVESAKEALELDKHNAGFMDTLAAAYAEAGDFEQAVRWQEQALQNNNDTGFRQRLELYRKKMPYRAK